MLRSAGISCTVDLDKEGPPRCRAERPGAPASSRSPSGMDMHPAGFVPVHSPSPKQAPDIWSLGDQDKQGPTVADAPAGEHPTATDDASPGAPTAEHHHQEESHDGQRLCRSSAPRAG